MLRLRLLVVDFRLEACQSLKEKRHRLLKLRDRFGKIPQVAVIESDFQNHHARSQWSFVIAGTEPAMIEKLQSQLELYFSHELDAVIEQVESQWI